MLQQHRRYIRQINTLKRVALSACGDADGHIKSKSLVIGGPEIDSWQRLTGTKSTSKDGLIRGTLWKNAFQL